MGENEASRPLGAGNIPQNRIQPERIDTNRCRRERGVRGCLKPRLTLTATLTR